MTTTADFDAPWKDALQSYFPQFIGFFFPAEYAAIDWSKGVTFLDGELQKITRKAKSGRRFTDKLARVSLLDGSETILIIHVEIQSQKDKNFATRMFTYYFRLLDLFNLPIASFAILADTNKSWIPQNYRREMFGTRLQFDFSVAKLLDYDRAQLELDSLSDAEKSWMAGQKEPW